MVTDATQAIRTELDESNLVCQFLTPANSVVLADRKTIKTGLRYLLRLVIDAASNNGGTLEFSITQDETMLHLCVCHPGEPIQSSRESSAESEEDALGFRLKVLQKIVNLHNGRVSTMSDSAVQAAGKPGLDSNLTSKVILSFPITT